MNLVRFLFLSIYRSTHSILGFACCCWLRSCCWYFSRALSYLLDYLLAAVACIFTLERSQNEMRVCVRYCCCRWSIRTDPNQTKKVHTFSFYCRARLSSIYVRFCDCVAGARIFNVIEARFETFKWIFIRSLSLSSCLLFSLLSLRLGKLLLMLLVQFI